MNSDLLNNEFKTFGNSAKRLTILPIDFSDSDMEQEYKERREWINTLDNNKTKSFTRILVLPKDMNEYSYEIINNFKENEIYGEKIYTISLKDYKNLVGNLDDIDFWIFDDDKVISIEAFGETYKTKVVTNKQGYIELFNKLLKNSKRFDVIER